MYVETTATYAGDGTSGVYLWGAQITATAFPVPYVPTTSATVTRNSDSMVISGTDFSDWFNPVEGTILTEATLPLAPSAVIWQMDDGTNNNAHRFIRGSALQFGSLTLVGGSSVADLRTGALASGQRMKSAYTYSTNAFAASYGGETPLTDSAGAVPTGLSRFIINPFSGYISRLIYWPKALTTAELQRMTA